MRVTTRDSSHTVVSKLRYSLNESFALRAPGCDGTAVGRGDGIAVGRWVGTCIHQLVIARVGM
jgi:hypothetical protein